MPARNCEHDHLRGVSGVYALTNTVNGKQYIGSSSDVLKRWQSHRSKLNNKKHVNPHLQSAWSQYGSDSFEISVLLESDNPQADEQDFLDRVFDYRPTIRRQLYYNQKPTSDAPPALSGEDHPFYGGAPEHVVEAIRESAKSGEERWNYGREMPDWFGERVSEAKSGVPLTEDHKEALSEVKQGEKHNHAKMTADQVREARKRYESENVTYAELAENYPVTRHALKSAIRGHSWSHIE